MLLPEGDRFLLVLGETGNEMILTGINLKRLSNPLLYSDSYNGLGWMLCLELMTDENGSPSSTFDTWLPANR